MHRTIPLLLTAVALCAPALLAQADAQSPAPVGESVDAPPQPVWLQRGTALLASEDPVEAWRAFRDAPADDEPIDRAVGMGRAHLMLGNSEYAVSYGEQALGAAPGRQDAMALTVRALIRAREFDLAVRRARAFVARSRPADAELLAARGSALFRVQRTDDAASVYQEVVQLDREHAEAHLRLGSGLLPPTTAKVTVGLRLAVGALAAGERARALELLQRALVEQPGHPIAHRLLGETLFADRTAGSMALQDEAFASLRRLLPEPAVRDLPIAEFVPGYRGLSKQRRVVVDRTAALFRSRLQKLVAVGGRHDLLHELERTTDADARSNLRGRRTFDGRVWDDVRGVGGMQAATGIEALDEAATFGFDTFAHEVAHQVHFFTFSPVDRARIRSLYRRAMEEQRCLDYYAASNEAEYFGQGVEAFVSLAKRPGSETTHGHTRFELKRLDPELHAFIEGLVDFDPLQDPKLREPLLDAAVRVAIRCGRPLDAVVAAEMMRPGARRDHLLRRAREAERVLRAW